jgi:uncharacterized protein YbcI
VRVRRDPLHCEDLRVSTSTSRHLVTGDGDGRARPERGQAGAFGALGDAISRLYKDAVGKGPTKARVRLVDDVLLCMLQDGHTAAERFLVEHGRADHVAEGRRLIGAALEARLAALAEDAAGRRVVSVVIGCAPADGRDIIVFVLAREDDDGVERSAAAQRVVSARELRAQTHAVMAQSEQMARSRRTRLDGDD